MQLAGTIIDLREKNGCKTTSEPSKKTLDRCAENRVVKRYGSYAQFYETFSYKHQAAYTMDVKRVFRGSAPTLAMLTDAYGNRAPISWLRDQLTGLSEFAGVQNKMTQDVVTQLAQTISQTYSFLKVTELMLFFVRYKNGVYGEFYGTVDPMKIGRNLYTFCQQRQKMLEYYEREEQARQRNLEYEKAKQGADEMADKIKYYGVGPRTMVRHEDLYDGHLTPQQAAEELKRRLEDEQRKIDSELSQAHEDTP